VRSSERLDVPFIGWCGVFLGRACGLLGFGLGCACGGIVFAFLGRGFGVVVVADVLCR
jgi:hypothetical protein